jgi:predicted adenine nucleotide alpha hydrolase (AANH) superfamily ATPase
MSEKLNYGKMLDDKLKELDVCGKRPRLLLHACCAPCSSYVLEYLCAHFDITVLYYNPNIFPEGEYNLRAEELLRLVGAMQEEKIEGAEDIKVQILPYTPSDFEEISKGREDMAEGGARCFDCYRLRLEKTAHLAREQGFDYFCTTLSISPHKNAQVLNRIGAELSEKYGIAYLFSDFKKKGGYKRSCELSAHYGLYRQDFCGCIYSKNEAEKRSAGKGKDIGV